jgi:outer membrane protein
MKSLLILLPLILVRVGYAQINTPDQFQKIGYANTQLILSKMPEYDRIRDNINLDIKQYENEFMAKVAEFEAKLKTYQQGASTMLDLVRLDRESELQRIQESIQKFQENAQVSLRRKEHELMTPIINKVGRAIDDVAKENGFTFVLNSSPGNEVVHFAESTFDISALVLEKLGIPSK